ncbi:MAG: 3-deoxy-D-manno-octulosonic acid transferase [Alphaproteobacteria bacterium]
MMPGLYRGLTTAAAPLIGLYLKRRLAAGKEDAARFGERLGHAGKSRPAGALVWTHAASVGEAVSVLPLIERVLARRRDIHVLVTTGTVTSARLMAERLPGRALHQYVPVDRVDAVRRFLDYWRPDLALWIESEFWPNLLGETRKRAIPCILVNGRMSDASFARWRRWPRLIAPLLGDFALCLAQDESAAQRLERLGAGEVRRLGNLKAAAAPLPADAEAFAELRATTAGRPLWLAASTHAGEEAIAVEVHRALARVHPGLLTVIAPRHPERGAAIAAGIGDLAVTLRSRDGDPGTDTAIYVADTLGELGLFYRLSEVVFVGGSLAPDGGHNPLEPARLGCALVWGPHMFNFADIAAALSGADAGETVADAGALARAVAALLADETLCRNRAEVARRFAGAGAGVLDAVEAAIAPWLDALPGGENDRARA